MATRRVAITLPVNILERADQWARKEGRSRSRLIADLLDTALAALAETEVTRLYNEAYESADTREENAQLAEEMHDPAGATGEDDKW